MISRPDREKALELIQEARISGARLLPCCEVLKISVRTYERWRKEGGTLDKRKDAVRKAPANKLSPEEQENILDVCNKAEYADLNPTQIVPKLADQGIYLASESTIYRILKAHRQHGKRREVKAHGQKSLTTHIARGPNEVWTWDITWLDGPIKGMYYKLYLIVDLFSRMIVQWEIHETERQAYAMDLIKKAVYRHPILGRPLILHSDNGSPMKGQDFQHLLAHLGITKSYSRPRVSNDNAYSESLFKTLKYTKGFPLSGFCSIEAAREWVSTFVMLYNTEFLHSSIKFVTPHQRHYGLDQELLKNRTEVYLKAQENNPKRWSRGVRNWDYIDMVTLNPVRQEEVLQKTRHLS